MKKFEDETNPVFCTFDLKCQLSKKKNQGEKVYIYESI